MSKSTCAITAAALYMLDAAALGLLGLLVFRCANKSCKQEKTA